MAGKIAIVTGAAKGIGKAIAEKQASLKDIVIITDISESGEKTSSEIKSKGYEVYFEKIDVTDFQNVNDAVRKIFKKFGRIDILVNNAGIRPTKPFGQMEFTDWQRVLDVNLNGVFNFCSIV